MTSKNLRNQLAAAKGNPVTGARFFPGRTRTSHVSISFLTSKRISIAAPVPTLSPYNLARQNLWYC